MRQARMAAVRMGKSACTDMRASERKKNFPDPEDGKLTMEIL